jgi:hypothetical protein
MADLATTGLANPAVTSFATVTTLESVTPDVVEDEGGCEIYVLGIFQNLPATVSIVLPDLSELVCYSGTFGRGNAPLPLAPSVLKAVTPPLPIGGPYDVRVQQGASDETLSGVLTAVARNWRSGVLAFRRLFPPWYRTGFRRLDTVNLLVSSLTVQMVPDLDANISAPRFPRGSRSTPSRGSSVGHRPSPATLRIL